MQFVWLASYPRSGSNFLRHVIEQVFDVRTWTRYAHDFYDDLFRKGRSSRLTAASALTLKHPFYLIKTHSDDKEANTRDPAILLVRDGRDTLCSHARFDLQYGKMKGSGLSFREALKIMIKGEAETYDGRGWDWSRHASRWRIRSARTIILKFEDLVEQPVQAVTLAVDAVEVGIPKRAQTGAIAEFSRLHKASPALFRRGKVGAWREEMDDELHELFVKHHGEEMRILGYEI